MSFIINAQSKHKSHEVNQQFIIDKSFEPADYLKNPKKTFSVLQR